MSLGILRYYKSVIQIGICNMDLWCTFMKQLSKCLEFLHTKKVYIKKKPNQWAGLILYAYDLYVH